MQLSPYQANRVAIDPSSPRCDDCQLPAAFRAVVADLARGRQVRVYQCENCAKVIWNDD
jgi:uncharacterized protein with PIN domain